MKKRWESNKMKKEKAGKEPELVYFVRTEHPARIQRLRSKIRILFKNSEVPLL
jgi:hypothetical protein